MINKKDIPPVDVFGSVYLLAPLARPLNSLYPFSICIGVELVFILQC